MDIIHLEARVLRKVVAATTLGLLPVAAVLPATPASATQGTTAAIEVTVTPPKVAPNGQVTVVGRVTNASGNPIADAETKLWWHSNTRDGAPVACTTEEGPAVATEPAEEEPVTCKTDADGMFLATVDLDDPGAHRFVAEYVASDGTAQDEVVAWAVPSELPATNGDLASDNGVVFAPGVRTTKVTGSGYQADAPVAIIGYPNGDLLATTTARNNGDFEADVTLPDTYSGGYTLASLGSAVQTGKVATAQQDAQPLALRTLTLPISVLATPASVPASAGALTSSSGTTFAASSLTTKVSGTGYEPSTTVSILVYSTPVVLATGVVAGNGSFEVNVTLPTALAAGTHTLVAMGQSSGNTVTRVLTLEITMSAAASSSSSASPSSSASASSSETLPVTGGSAVPVIATVGVLMLLAGAGLMVAARRRRISFSSAA